MSLGFPAFDRYIGIDYSGAETPTASLTGLRVYMADRRSSPTEVHPPVSPRKYWTRRGIAEWLAVLLEHPAVADCAVSLAHGSALVACWDGRVYLLRGADQRLEVLNARAPARLAWSGDGTFAAAAQYYLVIVLHQLRLDVVLTCAAIEMVAIESQRCCIRDEVFDEKAMNGRAVHLATTLFALALHHLRQLHLHPARQREAIVALQYKGDAALA